MTLKSVSFEQDWMMKSVSSADKGTPSSVAAMGEGLRICAQSTSRLFEIAWGTK
jgi:hypothetical protein